MNDDAMHADPQLQKYVSARIGARVPALAIIVVFLLAWVFAVYWRTTYSMVSIWERSETFAHGFVVVPIFLYLLWRQRETIAAIEPRPFLPALLGVVGAGAVWFIGERLSIISLTQFAMMAMVPLAVWAVLGTETLKALLFPLAFLFFAVPFGEFLVPPLMNRTADFATIAIKASGVPVFREGNFLTIPSGAWSIVEACSGLRYLIASFMVGCLFAYLSYRSPIRRAAFIAASLVIPIVANWVRVYMIIMLGHLTDNRIAAGADHLIYGWVVFGVVMALLFWIGAKWREDDLPTPVRVRTPVGDSGRAVNPRAIWISLASVLALTAVWPVLESQHAAGNVPAASTTLAHVSGERGWTTTTKAVSDWRPDVSGATAELKETLTKDGASVGLFLALFRDASPNAKAITSANQLVRSTNRAWVQVANDTTGTIGDPSFNVRTAVVARGRERLAVWQWYWVDGHLTASEYVATLYQAWAVIQGHGNPVAWVVIYTPTTHDESQVRATLQAFTSTMREPIDALLRQAVQAR